MVGRKILELFVKIISPIFDCLPPVATDVEMGIEGREVDDASNHEQQFPFLSKFRERIKSRLLLAQTDLNWSKSVVAFCFASALEITHYSQSQSQSHRVLASSYLLLCFAIAVSFSCIFVAKFIPGSSRFAVAARVLENVGVVFAVTAFFMAITSPFPLSLKLTIWAIYALSLLVILCSTLF